MRRLGLGHADEVEEQVLEAAPAGVDGVDAAARGHHRRDEVRDAVRVQAADDEPALAVVLELDRTRRTRSRSAPAGP